MEGLKALFDGFRKTNGQSESRHDFSKLWSRYILQDVLKFLRQFKKKSDLSSHVEIATCLIKECTDEWLIDSIQQQDGTSCLHKKFQEIVSSVFVPTFHDKEHYAFDENDFPYVASHAEKIISFVIALFVRLRDLRDTQPGVTKFIFSSCPIVVMLALEHIEERLWTTESSIKSAEHLFKCLQNVLDVCENSKLLQYHLVLGDEIKRTETMVLYKIFQLLKLKLQRETWKKNPGAKSVFIWCLNQTSFPVLSQFLENVLPPALLFTDDYMVENKVSGVDCLMHIINNVSAEELRWYGRGEVILEALKHQVYTREPELLAKTIPALLSILKVVEKGTPKVATSRPVTKFEEIYQQLLQNAEGENILNLRRIYSQYLHSFVEAMEISTVRYLEHTIKVIGNFLEISDGPYEEARFHMIELLQKVIRYCWPRVPCYMDIILKMLVKCLCDLSLDSLMISEEVKGRLVTGIKESLVMLKCLDSQEVVSQLQPLDCVGVPDLCREVCKQVAETDVTTFACKQ